MVELTDKPLKRGIPLSDFYVSITKAGLNIKVRGSRHRGLVISWSAVIDHCNAPIERPAKISTPREYLDWVASKRRPPKPHAKQRGRVEIGRHA